MSAHSAGPSAEFATRRTTSPALLGVFAAAHAANPEILDQLAWGAARLGDEATLRLLLEHGAGLLWSPSEGSPGAGLSCLCVAARGGHERAVRILLEEIACSDLGGAEVRIREEALRQACMWGRESVVRAILEAGVDFDKALPGITHNEWTPLILAVHEGHGGVIRLLLKAGADANKAEEATGWTPLIDASQGGYDDIVRQLLEAGAEADKPDIAGCTPLLEAALNGHTSVCSRLIGAGANLNYITNGGTTALGNAMGEDEQETALLLLRRGASTEMLHPNDLKKLLCWSMEEMEKKDSEVEELRDDVGRLVQNIPEWCAQAASEAVKEAHSHSSSRKRARASSSEAWTSGK